MSLEQAEAFLDSVQADEKFAQQLNEHRTNPDTIQTIVREAGFDATPDEIREVLVEKIGSELSEDQLAAIAGGLSQGDQDIAIAVGASVGVFGFVVTATAAAAAI
jgi:predicted ribosomally synthesized peptide with nif11-like leader